MAYSLVIDSTIGGSDTSGSAWTNVDSNTSLQTAIANAVNAAVTQVLSQHNMVSTPPNISFTTVPGTGNPVRTSGS